MVVQVNVLSAFDLKRYIGIERSRNSLVNEWFITVTSSQSRKIGITNVWWAERSVVKRSHIIERVRGERTKAQAALWWGRICQASFGERHASAFRCFLNI
jgi:hypothetical protein